MNAGSYSRALMRIVLAFGLVLGLFGTGWRLITPARADTPISFETPAQTDGTPIRSQFASLGVTFITGGAFAPSYPPEMRVTSGAHSGTHVLQIAPSAVEFSRPALAGVLSLTHRTISLWVRNVTPANFSSPMQLQAFDSSGHRVDGNGNTYVTISSTVSAYTRLTAQSTAQNIAGFLLTTDPANTSVGGQRIWVDDLTLDTHTGSSPDFSLRPPATGYVQLPAGGTVSVPVPVDRLNGSSGPIALSIPHFPVGVSWVFSPNPTSGTSALLTLRADASAPRTPVPMTVTITGHPEGAAAGFADRSTTFSLEVVGSGADARVLGMEITQAIQTYSVPVANPAHPDASVAYAGARLFAQSKTVVRVFANAVTSPYASGQLYNIGAILRGFHSVGGRAGMPLPGPAVILPDSGLHDLRVGPAGSIPRADRLSDTGGYTFTLPVSWVNTPGDIVLQAQVNPPGFSTSLTECSRCTADNTLTVTGIRLEPPHGSLTVAPVEIEYIDPRTGTGTCAHPSPGAVCVRPPSNTSSVFNMTRRVVPLPPDGVRVLPYDGRIVDVSDIAATDYSSHGANAYGDRRNDVFNRVAAYNWDHNVDGALAIGIHAGAQPGPTYGGLTVGDFGGLEAPVVYFGIRIDPVAIVDPQRPLASVTHEFMHTQGYFHAGTLCNVPYPNVSWPPDQRGDLDGVGLNLTPGSGSAPRTYHVINNGGGTGAAEVVDIMSYCQGAENQVWMSLRHWNSWGNLFPDGVPTGAVSFGGTPSPHTQTLHVTASIRGDGTGQILDVRPGAASESVNASAKSPYWIDVLDGNKKLLSETHMAVGGTHGEPDGRPLRIVTGEVPANETAAIVELWSKDGLLAAVERSPNRPQVKLTSDVPKLVNSGSTITLQWKADDADKDSLTSTVEFSSNGGKTFRMLTTGLPGDAFTIDGSSLERSNNAVLRLTVSDGFNTTSVQTGPFTTAGRSPAVTILDPQPKETVLAGATLFSSGQAYDDAGNYLTGKSLRWLADGKVLGYNNEISTASLPIGPHKLVLEATDSSGRTGSAEVLIQIVSPKPKR